MNIQMSRSPKLRAIIKYCLAVISTIVATLIRMALDPILGDQHPYVTFMFAIIFTAWYGGVGPSLVTIVLGFLAALFFFVYPRGSVEVNGLDTQIGLGLYVTVGVSSVLFSESMRNANRRANATAVELLKKHADLERETEIRRQAQQSHVELLRRMVNIQEDERRRLSRELHDQCGQDLTAMRLGLKFLEESIPVDEVTGRQFKNVRDLMDQISKEMHHISVELRPPALDELGLEMAVDSYAREWSSRSGISIDVECRGLAQRRAPDDIETALYRVLQEALTNVARHAEAKRVSVVLERSDAGVSVIVEDQGRGFDLGILSSNISGRRHLGVRGMQERLEAVGGSLEIESIPGTGTTVYARVPFVKETEAKSHA